MADILTIRGLAKRFGAVVVADGLDLALREGETLGVLGPNGAGKTTLFNMIAGALAPDAGVMTFEGRDITRADAADRCRLGVARSFQIPLPFLGLTVFENLLTPAFFSGRAPRGEAEALCVDVLERTGLAHKANARAESLTLLERKRLELARALASRPRLLLLDEIAGGLTPHECDELLVIIHAVKAQGVSIIWIEHVVQALLAAADRLFVLHQGRRLAEGAPHDVMTSREVRDVYLGADVDG